MRACVVLGLSVVLQGLLLEKPSGAQESGAKGGLTHVQGLSSGKPFGDSIRDGLDQLLTRRIREIEQMFELTPTQRQKLKLAGTGDIKRLLESVKDSRKEPEWEVARGSPSPPRSLPNVPEQLDLADAQSPFGIGSLFHKTLRKMFDEKQLQRRSLSEKKAPARA